MYVSRDSLVGIATRYGLVGPRIESRWGQDLPHPQGVHPAAYKMGTVSFPWVWSDWGFALTTHPPPI